MFLIPHNGLENNFKIVQCFCGPIQVHIPNGTLISSAVLAELMAVINRHTLHLCNCPLITNPCTKYQ